MSANSQPVPVTAAEPSWWRSAVIYQIYPRSFADGNGDGIGDLAGIRSRLPYLVDLGVDAIWISPFYPSPQADAGYDVADYRDIDPVFGTLPEFSDLVAECHRANVRVIVDLVPNHTSDQHAWFQAALAAGPGSPERARYLFREGRGPTASCRPTTGCPTSAARPGPGCRTGSGTCTCSPRSSPTWTGPTRRSWPSSTTSCASG
jgi:alpha-glucosidase